MHMDLYVATGHQQEQALALHWLKQITTGDMLLVS
jgi:hypothetical protein